MLLNKEKFDEFEKFSLNDFEKYRKKSWGNGSVGGKAKGLFFAKEILDKDNREIFRNIIVPESQFITTEIFDNFIEINNLHEPILQCEWNKISYEELESSFLEGSFSDEEKECFEKILTEMDYPLAIRSSSVLEDSLKYAFAGKYLTTYISNIGSMEKRLNELEIAIKQVFASTYGPNPIAYRKKHNLRDEKMAVIVQRLIGRKWGGLFYPENAGVAFSRNFRRWTERIKVEDGGLRVVFGLGTTSTGRGYARTFSLTNYNLRPEGNNNWEIAKHSQETYDGIDLETGELKSININNNLKALELHKNFSQYAQLYLGYDDMIKDIYLAPSNLGIRDKVIFTFNSFPKNNQRLFELMKNLFEILEREMGTAMDIEFTYDPETKVFGLIQARPLSSYEEFRKVKIPEDIREEKTILKADRMITNGKKTNIKYLVLVSHDDYYASKDKITVAREIGAVNKRLQDDGEQYILVGPGRWGSSNHFLGVPVNYNEISGCSILVEMGIKKQNFVPELSYGTHFFYDLQVDGVLYMPVFDTIKSNKINTDWFENTQWEKTSHPAIRIYKGNFNAYLDAINMEGIIISD